MSGAGKIAEDFVNEYMEKIFYFCLKKTGNNYDAEDLSQDIALCILSQINLGVVPENFQAYVWKIARNRYAKWADKKNKTSKLTCDDDIEAIDLPSDEDIGKSFVHEEELALLRRELAFASSEYRNLLVAYYIQEKSIKDISFALSLPEGTVKSRLSRARNILKEGMNMSRTFGKLSYAPEDIDFVASGPQPSGLPWRAVERKTPKNILLAAYNNPSTTEELAMELGISAPYMEEEVKMLTDATLLKKTGEKYVTNFCILGKEEQEEIYGILQEDLKERSQMIDAIAEDVIPQVRALGAVRCDMEDADIKWWTVIHVTRLIVKQLEGFKISASRVRENGESWDFLGYEKTSLPNCVMGHNGYGNMRAVFWCYKINDYNMCNRIGEMSDAEAVLLWDIIKNKRKISRLTEIEKKLWSNIDNRFVHVDKHGNVIPDILVFEKNMMLRLYRFIEKHPMYGKVSEGMRNTFYKIICVLNKSTCNLLTEQCECCASSEMLKLQMMVVRCEVGSGNLIIPPNINESRVAMWMEEITANYRKHRMNA